MEIIETFYSCHILHNIAVKERVMKDDGSIESDAFFEVVDIMIKSRCYQEG
jgi:hypothetical protein